MSTTLRWRKVFNRLETTDLAFILSELGDLHSKEVVGTLSKRLLALQNLDLMLDEVQFQLDSRQLVLKIDDPGQQPRA
jgi:hypothetical protein